jgi:asparagine synthase (glutamine-hydrolysing)
VFLLFLINFVYMCGIAGYWCFKGNHGLGIETLKRMIYPLRHRGPDGNGFFLAEKAGLAHSRLAIVDVAGGAQPMTNEDRSLWITFNGEIFNYPELRRELQGRGHVFATRTDTEVILHLYEELGEACVSRLNGQFAFAIYDNNRKSLFLARDRMGIRPLFYMVQEGVFYFASEIKALFNASPRIHRRINSKVLSDVFTLWSPVGTDTLFADVHQLLPGHSLVVEQEKELRGNCYWQMPFEPDEPGARSEQDYADELRALLVDAIRLQLRADVPVGAYLSGGLDSSVVAALVKQSNGAPLQTFSVSFADKIFDEAEYQDLMVDSLDIRHNRLSCGYGDIAEAFPEVVCHTEVPVLRTAPVPLYLLSRLVRRSGFKVVLTGEGADEILGGYDLFKEAKIRAFIHSQPDSVCRPLLLKKLYPYLALNPGKSVEYARRFFAVGDDVDDPFYSHRPRWKTTSGTHMFLSAEVTAAWLPPEESLAYLDDQLKGLNFFNRAQLLESRLLMANYLLCSQGDRVAMANSVEGRFPFLDHRLVEFSGRIPVALKMKGLKEKNILKKAMAGLVPERIVNRVKQPYMAPDIMSFFSEGEPEYLDHYLSPANIKASGLFKAEAVARLLVKCRKGVRQGFRENMAFVGILSTQILYDRYIANFSVQEPKGLDKVEVLTL